MSEPLRIFIGYDKRENDAYLVCANSLRAHASIPLDVLPLDIDILREDGLYTRTHSLVNGHTVDDLDGRPFSTWFAFTRFLVPRLMNYKGWAIFCDCDFLYTRDIAEILPMLDPSKAVMVVKHVHIPREFVKMEGQSQASYPRKNWSSFIAWNCGHQANLALTSERVNTMPGRSLHAFNWLSGNQIGGFPVTWNWLSGVSEPLPETPAAIHFTLGIPRMKGHENAPYADLWRAEFNRSAHKELAS